MLRSYSLAFVIAICAGCGGPSGSKEAEAPAPMPPPPRTPLPFVASAPRGLVATIRVQHGKEAIDWIHALGVLPREVVELADGYRSVEEYVDFTQPFDIAVFVDTDHLDDRDPKVAVSVPIHPNANISHLLSALALQSRSSLNGTFEVPFGSDNSASCALFPQGGRSHLVCANDKATVNSIGPWISGRFSQTPETPDHLSARIYAKPWQDKFLSEARQKLAEAQDTFGTTALTLGWVDEELLGMSRTLADEALSFLGEIDTIDVGVRLQKNPREIHETATLKMHSANSWGSQVISDWAKHPTAPPEAYWKLPSDATMAFYGTRMDAKHFTGAKKFIRKSLGRLLDVVRADLTVGEMQAMTDLLDAWPDASGAWVTASGYLSPVALPQLPKGKQMTPARAVADAKNTARRFLPWTVSNLEGDLSEAITLLERLPPAFDAAVAYARREYEKLNASDALDLGKARAQPARADRLPRSSFVRNPPGFPQGSALVDIVVPFTSEDVWPSFLIDKSAPPVWGGASVPDFKTVKHPKVGKLSDRIGVRVVVIPDSNGHYWMGYSLEAEQLKKMMLGIIGGSRDTLASRRDLDRLKGPHLGGGFVTYASLLESLKALEQDELLPEPPLISSLVNAMPNKGLAPIFVLEDGTSGSAPSISLELACDQRWIDDLVAAIRYSAAHAASSHLQGPTGVPSPTP